MKGDKIKLRDWFALACIAIVYKSAGPGTPFKAVAMEAYRIADAMCEVRKQ